jgi:hypothetical protein
MEIGTMCSVLGVLQEALIMEETSWSGGGDVGRDICEWMNALTPCYAYSNRELCMIVIRR